MIHKVVQRISGVGFRRIRRGCSFCTSTLRPSAAMAALGMVLLTVPVFTQIATSQIKTTKKESTMTRAASATVDADSTAATIRPFKIKASDEALKDLRRRVAGDALARTGDGRR